MVVQQLENNPKSIAQPKVFPLHQFEFAKLVLVSGHWNTGAHIEARTNITGEGKTSQDIQQAWIPNSGCDDDVKY